MNHDTPNSPNDMRERLKRAREEAHGLRQEVAGLRRQVAAIAAERDRALSADPLLAPDQWARIQFLEGRVNELVQEKQTANFMLGAMEREIRGLREKQDALFAENERLRRGSEVAVLRTQISNSNAEAATFRSLSAGLRKEVNELREQRDAAKAECEMVRACLRRGTDYTELKQEADELREERDMARESSDGWRKEASPTSSR